MSGIAKFLIILALCGLLPWVAYFMGYVSFTISIWAHAVGAVAVSAMKIYDLFKRRNTKE
jgi:hypothetical protein